MPRYYFDVHDGEDYVDREGIRLKDAEEAQTQAVTVVTEMLNEKGSRLWTGKDWHMDVIDENGVRVGGLTFRAYPA